MSPRPAPEVGTRGAICLSPRDAGAVKLICLPHAGGNAQVFRSLASLLPAGIEAHGVELPGRGMRLSEPSLTSVEEIVQELDRALAPLVEEPYALLGASMGALLAFAWARSLRGAGRRDPQCLFALTARPPDRADPGWEMHALPRSEFELALRRYGGTPEAVLAEPELMELMVPMLRADFTVVETYVHATQPPLEVPIVALGGSRDAIAPPAELAGWAAHTTGPYRQRLFEGGHFCYRVPAVQAEIAALLAEALTLPDRP